jgi:hypothetical protein
LSTVISASLLAKSIVLSEFEGCHPESATSIFAMEKRL